MGYNPYRGTFEVEWDDEAEVVLAQLAFEEGESAEETQLKLKMIEIYNTKLDERQASIDITDPHILFPKNHSIRFDSIRQPRWTMPLLLCFLRLFPSLLGPEEVYPAAWPPGYETHAGL